MDASNINEYVTALSGLSVQQAQLVMSTKGLTTAQQQTILSHINLANATGKLTAAQMTEILTTEKRSQADAKALLLNTGLITSETAETTTTNIVTAAKLRELVATGQLTQAEAQLLAEKAGVILANQKEASSFTLLGGKLKNLGNSLLALGKAHPALSLLTLGATLFTGAIKLAEENNEKFIESQEELIKKLDESIVKYNDEISSLNSLQEKFQDAKGNKEALAAIQSELNQAIGETPGLLNGESTAYDIANQKINDRIERLKELRKLELEDKISAQKEIFNNTLVDNAMGIDHKFDYFSNHKIIASDTLGSEFEEYLEGIDVNRFETLQSIFTALKNNGYGNGEKSNYQIWKELIDSYGGAILDVEEIQDYFENQTTYAQDILSEYVNNAESIFSKEELNSIIKTLVESGYSQDLEGIEEVITSLIENNELENAINEYYESLYNDNIDSDALYQNIKTQFDTLINNYPELKGILENYFNSIGKDIENGINTSTKSDLSKNLSISETIDQLNTKLKPSFDALGEAYQEIFTLDDDNNKEVFSLENVDLSMLDSIKSTIDEINENEELGIHIDYTDFENFTRVLTDTSSTSDQVKIAFNDFATSMFDAVDATDGVSESTAQLMGAMLESMGVANANEVVMHELALSEEEARIASIDWSSEIGVLVQELFNEANMASITKDEIYKLAMQEIAFGNNDLKVSDKIEKLKALAQAYGDTATEAIAAAAADRVANGHGDYDSVFSDMIASANRLKSENAIEIDFGKVDAPKSKSSGSKSDKHLEEYKTKLSMLEDQLDQQLITEREFFDKSEALLNQYLKDSPEHIEKYAEEISDAEKALHDNWVEAYEAEADELSRFRDKNLINVTEYYQSMMSLQDEYYNSEALKLTQLADKMEAEYGRMNSINLTRPTVTATDMQTAGYTTIENDSSTHAMAFGNEDKQVVVTPVLPNGTILSPTALTDYANKLLAGEKIDANIELAMFDGKDAIKQASEYVKGLESVQSEYVKLKKTFSENPYGNFTDEQLEAMENLTKELDNIMSELSGELGDIKSAYDNLIEIRDTYNKYGKISVDQYQSLCDMGFQYLALLSNESGALSLDEDAFQRLTDAKVQEMQVTLALQAVDLINNIQTEADAVQYLAASYSNLANEALNAAEQMLKASLINTELKFGKDSKQYQAAQTIVQGYQNTKLLAGSIGAVDVKMQSGGGYEEKKEEEKEKEPEIKDWLEKLLDNIERGLDKASSALEKISDKTSKLVDSVDKFFTWQKKNAMINRAVKSTENEIEENKKLISKITTAIKSVKNISNKYSEKLNEVELPDEYKTKIKSGSLEIEEIEDEGLQKLISSYEEWYGKIQDCDDKMTEYKDSIKECEDAIEELYEQQRELIRQKLENVIDYYSDMDSYLSSITAKMDSLISLNDAMGKRSSLAELVQQFADLNTQISSATNKNIEIESDVTEIDFGESKSVKEAIKIDKQEDIDSLKAERDNLDVSQSGTYSKLLKNIKKTEDLIDEYIENGWDETRSKKFDKLMKDLEDYYDMQAELDAFATSNTIANYTKVYTAYRKLQKKLDNGGTLTDTQQKKYNSYLSQLEKMREEKDLILSELDNQIGILEGTVADSTAEQKARQAIADVQEELEDTATYQNLEKAIEKAEIKLAEFEKKHAERIANDTLSEKQKKEYAKLEKILADHYAKREAFDENATASTIVQYNKIYTEWKKLQDRLDKGQNLSDNQWKNYNKYTEQLKDFKSAKDEITSELDDALDNAINPKDKLEIIESEYESASKGIYDSYQSQIDDIRENSIKETTQYQNLLAKAQKLEQKKKIQGLSKSEQDKLDKYNAELKALREGGTIDNISEYMKTWEKWYALQQKLEKNGKLSDKDAKTYDTYKAQLDAWNKEKQTQIDDLTSLMKDELEALKKTYAENISEAESEINSYYSNLYDLARQIAEYNLSTLETQLAYLEAYVSYYEQLVTLYDQFSGDKLTNLLSDLDIGLLESQEDLYNQYLEGLTNKYNATLEKIKEYKELISAAESEDYEGAMTIFKNTLAEYTKNGETDKANKIQEVIDLLNNRAESIDTEDSDLWLNEWKEALSSAKTELIGIAGSIQEVNDALREIKFSNITDVIQELDNAQDIISSIIGLINDEWTFNLDGNLTQYGITKINLLTEQMIQAQKEVSKYAELINGINVNKDTYSSDEAYQTALQEAKMNYLASINELKDYQDSIVAILTQADEKVVESLKTVISKRKEALQGKKELNDYDKNLKASQKEIDAIQAQIDALESLSGAMDTATKAKLAQLKADLEEKEEALQNTKDEHVYTLQINALDEFLETLSESLSNATKDVGEIIEGYKDSIDKAVDIYTQSKDSLSEWSNDIISSIAGLDFNINDNLDISIPNGKIDESSIDSNIDISSSIDDINISSKTNDTLDKLSTGIDKLINDGIYVDVELQDIIPTIDNSKLCQIVNSNLPDIRIATRQIPSYLDNVVNKGTTITFNYENLLNVEGSVDKDFAKVLPQHLEQAYEYTIKKMYKDSRILK